MGSGLVGLHWKHILIVRCPLSLGSAGPGKGSPSGVSRATRCQSIRNTGKWLIQPHLGIEEGNRGRCGS